MQPTASPLRVSCRKITSFRPLRTSGLSPPHSCKYERLFSAVNGGFPSLCGLRKGRCPRLTTARGHGNYLPIMTPPSPYDLHTSPWLTTGTRNDVRHDGCCPAPKTAPA